MTEIQLRNAMTIYGDTVYRLALCRMQNVSVSCHGIAQLIFIHGNASFPKALSMDNTADEREMFPASQKNPAGNPAGWKNRYQTLKRK